MRVLHINCNYIGTTLHQLMVENLDKLGHNNSVFVPTYDKNVSVIKPNDNVFVCECFKKWDRLFFNYKNSKILNAIESNYNVEDYNLIHAYTLFTDGNCARRLSKKFGIPYVVAVRNTDVNDFFRLMPHLRKLGIKTMLEAKAVFFLSESYRKQVFEKYIPEKYQDEIQKKSHIIPNGIDNFWFLNPPESDNNIKNTVKLIYAGRIDRNKNIPTTQRAAKILRERGYNVSFTVVGKVADEKVYKTIKKDSHTKCLPAQSKESLLELYRMHNIFVMPSFTESFGLVYAEAMSQGLPVIYSKNQGFDNQFPEGTVGYSVSAYDPQNVADGIEKTINNFSNIAPNAVSLSKKFNWEEITERYEKIYKDISGESRD
ncbi:MAG: glycosyltransferase family 4 protein [Ruminococcaceae bacterium]|nr:glycosyltransferase family 4 protein [Oscillospiraceae bacterium]